MIRRCKLISRNTFISMACLVTIAVLGILAYRHALAVIHRGTVYAPGYSDAAFKLVKKGMPKAKVKQLIGSPLMTSQYSSDKSTGHIIANWGYTRQRDNDSWWFVRVVSIDTVTDRVYEKDAWVCEP